MFLWLELALASSSIQKLSEIMSWDRSRYTFICDTRLVSGFSSLCPGNMKSRYKAMEDGCYGCLRQFAICP